ncbi:MAG: hypothetical protein ACKVHE_34810 [Planctomycetales bacterium]|jgi:hypothetical protein
MNRSERCVFGRVILTLFPIVYWWRGGMSFVTLLVIAVLLNLGFSAWDESRGFRCPVSYILARMVVTYWLLFFGPLFALFGIFFANSFWESMTGGFYFSYGLMFWMLFPNLISQTFAHFFVSPYVDAEDYVRLRAMGWSPIWDRGIIGMANPDSEVLRNSGIPEPDTIFVPPSFWKFRCPVCGARCPESWGVCWNCSYGVDGDATAYYEQYGRKD